MVDEVSEAEAEAAPRQAVRERDLLSHRGAQPEDVKATEDTWALGNAREAIREEPW